MNGVNQSHHRASTNRANSYNQDFGNLKSEILLVGVKDQKKWHPRGAEFGSMLVVQHVAGANFEPLPFFGSRVLKCAVALDHPGVRLRSVVGANAKANLTWAGPI